MFRPEVIRRVELCFFQSCAKLPSLPQTSEIHHVVIPAEPWEIPKSLGNLKKLFSLSFSFLSLSLSLSFSSSLSHGQSLTELHEYRCCLGAPSNEHNWQSRPR